MKIRLHLFLLLSVVLASASAQKATYRAKLIDESSEPVEFAEVLLLAKDSTVIEVAMSNADGDFSISGDNAQYLKIMHLAYQDRLFSLIKPLPEIIQLKSQEETLGEVEVSREQPFMELIEGGIPSYKVKHLFKNSVVTNAYEMLMRLPGIYEHGGVPRLVGSSSLTIVLNGKRPNMPQSQVLSYIKMIPIEQVDRAEVSYHPIPRYDANGGSVNIILKSQLESVDGKPALAGEVKGAIEKKNHWGGNIGTYLSYGKKDGLSVRASYDLEMGKTITDLEYLIFGDSKKKVPILESYTQGFVEQYYHRAFLNLDYIQNKHEVSADYYTTISPSRKAQEWSQEMEYNSIRWATIQNQTHHIALEYIYDGRLRVGGYHSWYWKNEFKEMLLKPDKWFENQPTQRNYVWGAYLHNNHTLPQGWQLNYGTTFTYSKTNDGIHYPQVEGQPPHSLVDYANSYDEKVLNGYIGMRKKLNKHWNLSLALKGSFMDYKSVKQKYVAPQLQVSYNFTPLTMLQLSMNTTEHFPSYWEREPFTSQRTWYSAWEGNPDLLPYTSYNAGLMFLLRGKYIFQIHDSYSPNYFVQLMRYDRESNKIIFSTHNWEYQNSLNLSAIIPFSFWKPLQSRLMVFGIYTSQKGDLTTGLSFDRNKMSLILRTNNSLSLSKSLSMEVSYAFVSGGIQGYYDLGQMNMLDVGMKWQSADKKWTIAVRGEDLLNRKVPEINASTSGQYFYFNPPRDLRRMLLEVKYSFGSFKRRSPAELDTSRF